MSYEVKKNEDGTYEVRHTETGRRVSWGWKKEEQARKEQKDCERMDRG